MGVCVFSAGDGAADAGAAAGEAARARRAADQPQDVEAHPGPGLLPALLALPHLLRRPRSPARLQGAPFAPFLHAPSCAWHGSAVEQTTLFCKSCRMGHFLSRSTHGMLLHTL